MTRDEIEASVRGFYRTRVQNDVEATLAWMAPGGTLRLAGAPETSQISRASESNAALRAQITELIGAWKFQSVEIQQIVIEGDRAAVLHRTRAIFAPTGETIDTEVFDLIRFANGRIVSFLEFLDTARIERMIAAIGA